MGKLGTTAKALGVFSIGVGSLLFFHPNIFAGDLCTEPDFTLCQIENHISDIFSQTIPNMHSFENSMWQQFSNTTKQIDNSVTYNSQFSNGIRHTSVSASSSGFAPNEDVSISINGDVSKHVRSDMSGNISYNVDLPNDTSPILNIQALGTTSRHIETWQLPE